MKNKLTYWVRVATALLLPACMLTSGRARAGYIVQRVAAGLNQPTYVTQAPGDDTSLYIVQRQGAGATIGDIQKYNPITHTSSTFIDLGGSLIQDGGVYGLAFHPDFQTNGLLYVSYLAGTTDRLDEYKMVGAAPQFQRTLLQYTNPATQHTIDWIGFQPGASGAARNNLYVTTGDGGIQADSSNGTFHNNGQDATTVMGKVLRLNVDPAAPDAYPADTRKNFAIPAGNPFVNDNTGKLKEIFETGHRNPWKASFDRATGDLYVGDVGFNTYEEVDFNKNDTGFASGRDYGWALREGTIPTPVAGVGGAQGNSINPIYQIAHPTFHSITGGYVYRGPIPELQGKYFFGDFNSGTVMSLNFDRNTSPTIFNGVNNGISGLTNMTSTLDSLIAAAGGNPLTAVVSFGEDNAGNLYIVDFTNPSGGNIFNPSLGHGEIYELIATPEPGGGVVLVGVGAATMLGRRRRFMPR